MNASTANIAQNFRRIQGMYEKIKKQCKEGMQVNKECKEYKKQEMYVTNECKERKQGIQVKNI